MENKTSWVMNPEDGELYPLPEYKETDKGVPGEPISLCKEDYGLKVEVVEEVPKGTLVSAVQEVKESKDKLVNTVKAEFETKSHNISLEVDYSTCGPEGVMGVMKEICIQGIIIVIVGALLNWGVKYLFTPEFFQELVTQLEMSADMADTLYSMCRTSFVTLYVGCAIFKMLGWCLALLASVTKL